MFCLARGGKERGEGVWEVKWSNYVLKRWINHSCLGWEKVWEKQEDRLQNATNPFVYR